MKDRYTEALNTAKMWYRNTAMPDNVKGIFRRIFSELRENEDEKIRKELICFIETEIPQCAARDKYIAWLEKQGERDNDKPNFRERYGKMAESEWFKKNYEDKSCGIDSESLRPQKPQDKPVSEAMSEPTDKIEPRFKVGDWVVANYTGRVSQVIDVSEDGYGYTLNDGLCFGVSWCDVFHPWNIKDAKDGDVLADDDTILLFKSYPGQDRISLYCWYYKESDNFHEKALTDISWSNITDLHPATEEQRHTLWSKMKKAGYIWNDERKEVIQIK